MKKLIVLILAAGLLQMSAYASLGLLSAECGTDGKTAVTGRIDKSEEISSVGLRVLKPDKAISELSGDPTSDLAITDFVDQTNIPAGETEFSFEFVLPTGESGRRRARLTGANAEDTENLTLWYVTLADYSAAITAVNGALADYDTFKAVCDAGDNALYLGFDESISESLSSDAVMQILYQSIKDGGLSADNRVETVRLWRAASLAALLNRGGADIADYHECLNYFGDAVKAWSAFVDQSGSAAKTRFESLLSGGSYQTAEQFKNRLKEALILTVTQYNNGVNNIGKILKDFSDITGIATDTETAVYQQLAGSYSSLSALLDKYKELKKTDSGGGSGGGGSGGGGSGGGGAGGGAGGNLVTDSTGDIMFAEPIMVRFNDLDMVDWAYEAIMTLADKGIINGRSENTFEPMATVTREEFVKLLVCAAGYENNRYTAGRFADVVPGEWYEKYVYIAADTGLVNGVGETLFGVGTDITRQDMAVMIYRALTLKGAAPEDSESAFADTAQIADYAKGPIGALSGRGLINGVGDNRFEPNGTATRAEAAQILFNVLSRISQGGV